jgi:hypothetical protein
MLGAFPVDVERAPAETDTADANMKIPANAIDLSMVFSCAVLWWMTQVRQNDEPIRLQHQGAQQPTHQRKSECCCARLFGIPF